MLCVGCAGGGAAGPADIVLGTGEFEYEAVVDGQDLPIVAGPQGGYHVWLGFLARGVVKHCVVQTDLTRVEDEAVIGNPLFFEADLFEASEAGWLQYAGLPLQFVPEDAEDQLIRVDVTITDDEDDTATASMQVVPRLL